MVIITPSSREAVKFGNQSEIISKAKTIALSVHKGQYRDTGSPYTSHFEDIEKVMKRVLRDTEYKNPTIGAIWLHDAVEVKRDGKRIFMVSNPYDPISIKSRKEEAENISNSLDWAFSNSGDEGKWICYMVYKMTHKDGISYMDYMDSIFLIAPSGLKRDLDIITLILKISDRHVNTNPDEKFDKRHFREEYEKFINDGGPESLINEYGISEYVIRPEEISFEGFLAALRKKLDKKILENAIDNRAYYLPKGKSILLEKTTDEDMQLFHADTMEEIIEECSENSDRIMDRYMPAGIAKRLGYNRE